MTQKEGQGFRGERDGPTRRRILLSRFFLQQEPNTSAQNAAVISTFLNGHVLQHPPYSTGRTTSL